MNESEESNDDKRVEKGKLVNNGVGTTHSLLKGKWWTTLSLSPSSLPLKSFPETHRGKAGCRTLGDALAKGRRKGKELVMEMMKSSLGWAEDNQEKTEIQDQEGRTANSLTAWPSWAREMDVVGLAHGRGWAVRAFQCRCKEHELKATCLDFNPGSDAYHCGTHLASSGQGSELVTSKGSAQGLAHTGVCNWHFWWKRTSHGIGDITGGPEQGGSHTGLGISITWRALAHPYHVWWSPSICLICSQVMLMLLVWGSHENHGLSKFSFNMEARAVVWMQGA